MKRLFFAVTASFLLINQTRVEAQEYTTNEYKAHMCAEYLSDALRWGETQRRIDRASSRYDSSFWNAHKKLVNRCKSYKNNTAKTLEKDYARLYAAYWD